MKFDLYLQPNEALDTVSQEYQTLLEDRLHIRTIQSVHILTHLIIDKTTSEAFDAACDYIVAQPMLCRIWLERPQLPGASFEMEQIDCRKNSISEYFAETLNFIGCTEHCTVTMDHTLYVEGTLTEAQYSAIASLLQDATGKEVESKITMNAKQCNRADCATADNFRFLDETTLLATKQKFGFHMSMEDLLFCQSYFTESAKRDPTLMELRIADCIWRPEISKSVLYRPFTDVAIQDDFIRSSFDDYLKNKEALLGSHFGDVTLADIIGMPRRYMKHLGLLKNVVEFEDTDSAGISVNVDRERTNEKWYLMIQNEGRFRSLRRDFFAMANMCAANALWDAFAARSYAFGAIRIGCQPGVGQLAADAAVSRMTTAAKKSAAGYQMYANACGFPTLLSESLNDRELGQGHLELTAVLSAAPQDQVFRKNLIPGDVLVLISSEKKRLAVGTDSAVARFASPETGQRMQRIFRDPDVTKLLKRCMKCRSGGIIKTVFDMTPGARLEISSFPYDSQVYSTYDMLTAASTDRLIVAINQVHLQQLLSRLQAEGLSGWMIGAVSADRVIKIDERHRTIVSLTNDFLSSGGASHTVRAAIDKTDVTNLFCRRMGELGPMTAKELLLALLGDYNIASKEELLSGYNFSAGCGTVLAPYCGDSGLNMPNTLAVKFPVFLGNTGTLATASFGIHPKLTKISPYHGAYYSAVYAFSKLVAAGQTPDGIYLSHVGEFPSDANSDISYEDGLSAALGTYQAQMDMHAAMLNTDFHQHLIVTKEHDVPALATFAVSVCHRDSVITSRFKKPGNRVYLLSPRYDMKSMLPDPDSLRGLFVYVNRLIREKKAFSVSTIGRGGIGGAVCLMCFGSGLGFHFRSNMRTRRLLEQLWGSFLIETDQELEGEWVGSTKDALNISIGNETIAVAELIAAWRKHGSQLRPNNEKLPKEHIVETVRSGKKYHQSATVKYASPRVLIPTFQTDHAEFDLLRRFLEHGASPRINRYDSAMWKIDSAEEDLIAQLENCQMLVFCERICSDNCFGVSSGKAVMLLRRPRVRDALKRFLYDRDGLILGVGGGFHVLGEADLFSMSCTAEQNPFRREDLIFSSTQNPLKQSRLVRVRTVSRNSPWLQLLGDSKVYTSVIQSNNGTLHLSDHAMEYLRNHHMIGSQYVDENANPSMSRYHNPPLSDYAIESLLSADGRILGKACHFEAIDESLFIQSQGNKNQPIIESGIRYYS